MKNSYEDLEYKTQNLKYIERVYNLQRSILDINKFTDEREWLYG